MNSNTIKALGQDALYQVLDNWVFRILAVLCVLPILLTFLVGFREDEIVFLFGVERWSYEGLIGFLSRTAGANPTSVSDIQGATIDALLSLVFDWGMGAFGVMFCIAATAFFVPAMIEKGAADVLFHKPISRLSLYLARYFAGLLFIGIVSLLLVGGMQLGLLLVSGYNDLGIFFGALQLTYVFGLLFTISMLIGVVTRSTVAATLLTVLFFMFNGCIHQMWALIEQGKARNADALAAIAAKNEGQEVDRAVDKDNDEDELEGPADEVHFVERAFKGGLAALHYVLPKTNDASIVASMLRKSIDPPLYLDKPSHLALFAAPTGWVPVEADEMGSFDTPISPPLEAHRLGELQLALSNASSNARFSLWRRDSESEMVTIKKKSIKRTERVSRTASSVEDELEERAGVSDVDRNSLRFGKSTKGKPIFGAARVHWSEDGTWRMVVLCKLNNSFLFTVLLEAPDAAVGEDLFESLDASMGLDSGTEGTWYSKQLALDAPLRFNLFFSIGSSVAFALLMLALGWWRLTRIEF